MATLRVIDTLFSMESPSTLVNLSKCGDTVSGCVAAMDEAGIAKALLAPCKRWECERHWVCGEIQIDEVLHCVASYPTRFAGLAAYNPLAISESLEQIDAAIRQSDFRGVYVQTEGSNLGLRDARMYPLYARCMELKVPLMLQMSANEKMNRSALADIEAVLIDFSELELVLAWAGEADLNAMRVMCERHATISVAFDGQVAPEQERELAEWMKGAGQQRCMWGSNGLPWKKLLDKIYSYPLSEKLLKSFLIENASRVFGLAQTCKPANFSDRIMVAE